ncbi:TetM/TetW/TetO/TetS family tetracycline resistance ribosomal protection protein [uncultured Clostridium sp.]|uniref:GTP-binding protein n=1 Tax=uncultured Clostridium sp. TaxID=59620 RepID=UPI0025E01587|nr:TetM/TetW/TetO/TetS family tetracycline resistance ribosomal protection protein [uncultured Clostridium sp.]
MKKTIGILAHVDSGKTTFSEQVLYHTKSIRSRGRVDHKNSFLDNHEIEKERGITVFSDQAKFQINDTVYYLVDTPGHVDFSSEMERTLSILDYAILLVNGIDKVQGHTETVWNLLRKYNIPTFIFINKIDRVGFNRDEVILDMEKNLSKDICFLDNDYIKDEKVIEKICEKDDELLEKYLEGTLNEKEFLNTFKKIIKEERIFPCLEGSALQDIGIEEFLRVFDDLSYTNYKEDDEFSGRIYKISYDEKGNRVTFIKALSGSLKVKGEINLNGNLNKINELRIYNANKYVTVEKIVAGDIFGAIGFVDGIAGQGIGTIDNFIQYNMIPTLTTKAIFDKNLNIKKVLNIFKKLEEEDPALNVVWDETLQEINIHIMGKIQLEILKELLKKRFDLDIDFGQCRILYKETIKGSVIGSGHFEPLRHYAEVHLKIEEGQRNKGITFESKCHVDNLNLGHQNLIKTHIFEREHHGLLTGSPLTDLKITLLTGRDHNKHTSGGDFRQATFRALRQGLEKAENILLEPYYKFRISVPKENMGRVLSDIQKLKGTFEPAEVLENKVIIRGRGPVKNFMNYSNEITIFSKGKGSISLMYDNYDVCHNSKEVIKEINYNKEADIEYTSTSIFCSKGQSYLVRWDEADNNMHCEL